MKQNRSKFDFSRLPIFHEIIWIHFIDTLISHCAVKQKTKCPLSKYKFPIKCCVLNFVYMMMYKWWLNKNFCCLLNDLTNFSTGASFHKLAYVVNQKCVASYEISGKMVHLKWRLSHFYAALRVSKAIIMKVMGSLNDHSKDNIFNSHRSIQPKTPQVIEFIFWNIVQMTNFERHTLIHV